MNIFRSNKLTKILPLLTAIYTILRTRRLQPPRDDCAVRVQWFSSVIVYPGMTQPQYWSGSPKNHKATEAAFNVGQPSARLRNVI